MKTENMYIVWAHPRSDSLTAQVVEEIQGQAAHHGINVTTLDLYRIGFNPALGVEDEPDWQNPQKQYSPEVHRLFGELEGKDTVVFVFPVWWYSFPAMLKGYLDRVWNYGLAYGEGGRIAGKKIRWVALVGGSQAGYVKYGWDKNMLDYTNGAMGYLGATDSNVEFIYNTAGLEEDIVDGEQHYQKLFGQARAMVDGLVE